MSEFIYLFRGGNDRDANLSPEQIQAQMQRWGAWMKELAEKGIFLAGDPLRAGGTTITGTKKVVTDGPFVEGKEMVGGYIIVKAGSLQEAVEISKSCPIFESNGIVEVREVEKRVM